MAGWCFGFGREYGGDGGIAAGWYNPRVDRHHHIGDRVFLFNVLNPSSRHYEYVSEIVSRGDVVRRNPVSPNHIVDHTSNLTRSAD